MINLTQEKKSRLTAEDIHDICDFAMQDADMNGFVSSYDFEHALWVYAADVIFSDRQDEIVEMITSTGFYGAYQTLLEDGTFEQLKEEYADEMEQIAKASEAWYNDYTTYATSIRGTLNAFQFYSGDLLEKGAKQLFDAQSNPDFKNTYEIADRWGMNNEEKRDPDDSLFF